jgi:hypothetical protein
MPLGQWWVRLQKMQHARFIEVAPTSAGGMICQHQRPQVWRDQANPCNFARVVSYRIRSTAMPPNQNHDHHHHER